MSVGWLKDDALVAWDDLLSGVSPTVESASPTSVQVSYTVNPSTVGTISRSWNVHTTPPAFVKSLALVCFSSKPLVSAYLWTDGTQHKVMFQAIRASLPSASIQLELQLPQFHAALSSVSS